MSLVLAAALAASTATLPTCSWDRPGANPFMGDVVAAVDRYSDIPAPARAALKARMAKRQYDDVARITRDSIAGKRHYAELRDMHFGKGRVCNTVTRDQWPATAVERGLVYCEGEHCVIVPTVCRNVSRLTRLPQQRNAAEDGGDGVDSPRALAGPDFPAPASPQGELMFEAPSAGATPSLADGLRDPLAGSVVGVPIASATNGWDSDPAGGPDAGPGSFASLVDPTGTFGILPIGTGGGTGGETGAGNGGSSAGTPGGGTGGGTGGGGTGNPGAGGGGTGGNGGPGGEPGGGGGGGNLPPVPPISPIPEASTWMMMLAGLAAVGVSTRRRRARRLPLSPM